MPALSVSVADDLACLGLADCNSEVVGRWSFGADGEDYDAKGQVESKEGEEGQGRTRALEQYLDAISCPRIDCQALGKSGVGDEEFQVLLSGIKRAVSATERGGDKRRQSKQASARPTKSNGPKYSAAASACVQTAYGNGFTAMDVRLGPEHFIEYLERHG